MSTKKMVNEFNEIMMNVYADRDLYSKGKIIDLAKEAFAKVVDKNCNLQMKDYIKKDKHGNKIKAGDKFKFKYLKELHNPIELIGSFDWNDDELRYEIDIWDNDEYVCLSYVGNGIMYGFELLS